MDFDQYEERFFPLHPLRRSNNAIVYVVVQICSTIGFDPIVQVLAVFLNRDDAFNYSSFYTRDDNIVIHETVLNPGIYIHVPNQRLNRSYIV